MRIRRTPDFLHQIYNPFTQLFVQVLLADRSPEPAMIYEQRR
jgi:hypothetical protein